MKNKHHCKHFTFCSLRKVAKTLSILGVGGFGVLNLEVGEDVLLDGDLGGALLIGESDDGFGDHFAVRRVSRGLLWLGRLLHLGGGSGGRGGGGFRHLESLIVRDDTEAREKIRLEDS